MNTQNLKNKLNKKGQSTIEFIMTFPLVVGMTFLFMKLAVNYTDGYYIHYATFMASRAYLTLDTEKTEETAGDNDAFKAATRVFKRYKPDLLITNFDGTLKENNIDSMSFKVFTGVWLEYTRTFAIGFLGGTEKVKLRSESFLGREPIRTEVWKSICTNISRVTMGTCEKHTTLDDNGG